MPNKYNVGTINIKSLSRLVKARNVKAACHENISLAVQQIIKLNHTD